MATTLRNIAEAVSAWVVGDGELTVDHVAPLHHADAGAVSFLSSSQFKDYLAETKATAVILSEDMLEDCPTAALVCSDPYLTYAEVATLLHPFSSALPGIHASASVDGEASVDPSASIGPQCVIERGGRIGPRVILGPGCVAGENARIDADSSLVAKVAVCGDAVIGKRAIIHPGAVIGIDGFGLANERGRWLKIPQLGRAVLGDDVEVGANTTIDRGALEDTVIKGGVKLDNQVHVAHNVVIGEHTAIAGYTGIAGSTTIGRHCMIAGQCAINGHIEIADKVTIAGMSVVTKTINEPGVYSSTMPAQPRQAWNRIVARLSPLDDIARRLSRLEKKVPDAGDE